MKKSTAFSVLCVLMCLSFCSCGEKKLKETRIAVAPQSLSISGDLTNYLEIVPGNCEIVSLGGSKMIVKVKATSSISEEELESKNLDLKAKLYDQTGKEIADLYEFSLSYDGMNELKKLLVQGSGEKSLEFNSISGLSKLADTSNKTFKLDSQLREVGGQTHGGDASEPEEVVEEESESNEDYDQLLADYETYVTDYISVYKKAMKGDYTAAAEYPTLLSNANELFEKMSKAQEQNKLTSSQYSKLLRIQKKLLTAASSI